MMRTVDMDGTYVKEFRINYDELYNVYKEDAIRSTTIHKPLKVEIDCSKISYTPKKVIFNGPATVVFWKDGTKTVVKCSDNDVPNPYNAFCAALAKKIFGNNSIIHKIVESGENQEEKK